VSSGVPAVTLAPGSLRGRWRASRPGAVGETLSGGALGPHSGHTDGDVRPEAVRGARGVGLALGALYGAVSASPSAEGGQPPVP
jgi:hypothetical protein